MASGSEESEGKTELDRVIEDVLDEDLYITTQQVLEEYFEGDSETQLEVAESLDLSPSSICHHLDKAREKGIVERRGWGDYALVSNSPESSNPELDQDTADGLNSAPLTDTEDETELETSIPEEPPEEILEEIQEQSIEVPELEDIAIEGSVLDRSEYNEIYTMTALAYVELTRQDTYGKIVMEELENMLGIRWSPGTLYPLLYDLEERNSVEMQEMVRTKHYSFRRKGVDEFGEYVRRLYEFTRVVGTVYNELVSNFEDEPERDEDLRNIERESVEKIIRDIND